MEKILILGLLMLSMSAFAQNSDASTQRKFATQGEQEDYLSENFFRDNYREEKYYRFSGTIKQLSPTSINFDSKTLIYWNSPDLQLLLDSGIFYPQLLIGYEPVKKDSAYFKQNKLFRPHDSVSISSFEELKFLSNSPKVKRFRFSVYSPSRMNPQVFFLELKNDKATKKTKLSDFIRGSRLTFFRGGWIMI